MPYTQVPDFAKLRDLCKYDDWLATKNISS